MFAILCVGVATAAQPKTEESSATIPPELQKYKDVFSTEKVGILPPQRQGDYIIDLEGQDLLYRLFYNLLRSELSELRCYFDNVLLKNWIQYLIFPAGTPILFVLKKDRGLCLCVNYRELNEMTIKNRYLLSLITEMLDRLSGVKYFTKLNFKDAYHRIRIKRGDEQKIAFRI